MQLSRLRGPALAGFMVLMVSGAGMAFAGSPRHGSTIAKSAPAAAPAAVAAPATIESTAADTDNVQQGNQTTPDTAPAGESEATTPETGTDDVQQGDQTTPDAPVAVKAAAPAVIAVTSVTKAVTVNCDVCNAVLCVKVPVGDDQF